MSSADPGAGAGERPEAGSGSSSGASSSSVSSSGVGSSSFGAVGDNATFKWELKRSLTHIAWIPVSACLVIAVTAGFAVFAVAQWPGGPQSQYVWCYVLAALALLGAGAAVLYPADRAGRARGAERQAVGARQRGVVRAVLVGFAALCCGGGALAWVDVDRTGEVGVEMNIQGAQPVDDTGGTLTVEMARPPADDVRNKLRLTLTIVDDDPTTPTCVGRTTAEVTAVTPGIAPSARKVPARSTIDFDLGGRQGALRFAVAVQPETGCSMRLAQARGTLHND
ncbi:hypothetical protein [Streptomyces varsoviensis]|uniref:Tat pathway signal sequence domain protein n=1 Tax=Streptomyces varsoviensis TaxID=67373 RepID=A0ABR5J5Q8_9ACTN|nr:hypothetical protein [Streptomyces varsoviensis]KOG88739.1 hypothetical protein ADK38_18115 [Streptomyces varsoviensis]